MVGIISSKDLTNGWTELRNAHVITHSSVPSPPCPSLKGSKGGEGTGVRVHLIPPSALDPRSLGRAVHGKACVQQTRALFPRASTTTRYGTPSRELLCHPALFCLSDQDSRLSLHREFPFLSSCAPSPDSAAIQYCVLYDHRMHRPSLPRAEPRLSVPPSASRRLYRKKATIYSLLYRSMLYYIIVYYIIR